MLYAFAEFFDILFDGPGVAAVMGVRQGFIPPSTALFMELHDSSASESSTAFANTSMNTNTTSSTSANSSTASLSEPFVRLYLWLPCNDTADSRAPDQNACPFLPLRFRACGGFDCPLSFLITHVHCFVAFSNPILLVVESFQLHRHNQRAKNLQTVLTKCIRS
jgi:hypothetical protein